jgi:uncharacterized protein YfbU (UPF0304 family)
MKLTDGERLIVAMLCELYNRVGVKGDIDPDFVQHAISSGHTWALKWKYHGLLHDEEVSDHVVKETGDILSMWRDLEGSYKRLGAADKERIEAEVPYYGKDPRFTGFDGNEESEHMGVARVLIERLERFEEYKGHTLNAHTTTLRRYRRMLAEYQAIQPNIGYSGMDADQIISVLNAK